MFKKFYKPSGQSSKANKGARLYSNSTSKKKKKGFYNNLNRLWASKND